MINSLIEAYEIGLLALMVWREARRESFEGKLQVAWTVRNRVEHPKWWGKTFSEVITKKWQYSSMTAPKDIQLAFFPNIDDVKFKECLNVAYMVYQRVPVRRALFVNADSYYDDSISPPRWATEDKRLGTIGHFSFFNIDGDTDD